MAKLSALEQARLEVETFENSIDVLLSIHKEPRVQWDWVEMAAALLPPAPVKEVTLELKARQEAFTHLPRDNQRIDAAIRQACDSDVQAHRNSTDRYEAESAEIESRRLLAVRVLDGESLAYLEAFAQFNPIAEFSSAGSLREFAVEQQGLISCAVKIDFESTIPLEMKSLTAGGKLTVKPMPKARRHDIYQDYVSACALRMAGEVFAMLPVGRVIVTVLADIGADRNEIPIDRPILSVLFDRNKFERLDFEAIAPAQAIEQFEHHCNFKVTRGSGSFQLVAPLTPASVMNSKSQSPSFDELAALVQELRVEIRPMTVSAREAIERKDDAE